MQAAELILAGVDDSGPLSDFSSDGEDNDIDQTAILPMLVRYYQILNPKKKVMLSKTAK